jgi:ABC-type phosphate transport system substrate-binding protein
MNAFGKILLLALCAAVGVPRIVMADTFQLKDGSIIRGVLASSSNGTCVISRAGGMPFALNCAEIVGGNAQPTPYLLPDAPKLGIAGSNTIGAKLMPALLTDYVRSRGAVDTLELPRVIGQDQVVIEPRPLIPNLWSSIELSAHGSATGFQGLAALAVSRQTGAAASRRAPSRTEEGIIEPQLESTGIWRSIEDGGAAGLQSQSAIKAAPGRQAIETGVSGVSGFVQGQAAADIAMSSRRVTPEEVSALAVLGAMDSPASEHVIALDGLAIIVNRANRTETLSRKQIVDIFTGRITDWEEVGGWPGPITRYARNDVSGTWDTFKHLVLKGAALSPGTTRFEDSRELAGAVATDPAAIGFVGMSYVGEAKAVNIRECNLVYPPGTFNAKTEEYPLSRRLYLYVPEMHSKGAEDFLNYVNTPRAQRIVSRTGFVDLSIEPDFAGEQRKLRAAGFPSRRNREDNLYANMLENGGRLSVTLRFRSNSANLNRPDLDSRAIYDLQRIREFMQAPQWKGRKIALVGFTDSVGDLARNRSLSLDRARSIANELKDVPVSDILGLGPSFPVACNDADEGRERNRRVEVWVTK